MDRVHETLVSVELTGGEPLVTKAGRALLQTLGEGKYKVGVKLQTNGQWIDFDLLKPVDLISVLISTDGATKEIYEQVRVGGNFDDLISNIKKFVELKKERPYMAVQTNYTVTSDNYIDIPNACELYEGLGLEVGFCFVIRDKDDPQNIQERADLYEPLLNKIDAALNVSLKPATKNSLISMQKIILKKMEEDQKVKTSRKKWGRGSLLKR